MGLSRRPLGRTGLAVTPIGLGLAALGRPGYINVGHGNDFGPDHDLEAVTQHAHRVLDTALDLGIGYVDAARSYGAAEDILAAWLRRRSIPPGTLTIGSKWGYTYTAGWQVQAEHHEVKDHSAATLRRQFAESQERLSPWLALYQVHSATLDSGVLDDRRVLDDLAVLGDLGLSVGLTTSGPSQAEVIRRALHIERDGRPLFAVVQSTWNVLERSAGAALVEAHAAGIGVIVKEAVANGRLTDRNPALPSAVRQAMTAAQPRAESLDQVAMAAAMAQGFADVVLSGAATVDQLRSNAAALELVPSIDLDALATVTQEPADYWAARSNLAWN